MILKYYYESSVGTRLEGSICDTFQVTIPVFGVGYLLVIVLAMGPKVRGFKPGRGEWIFNGDENP
jgi:hypothetical protein